MARGLKPTSMGTAAAADMSPGAGGLARIGGLSAVTLAPVARRPPLIHGGPRGANNMMTAKFPNEYEEKQNCFQSYFMMKSTKDRNWFCFSHCPNSGCASLLTRWLTQRSHQSKRMTARLK
eukprot:791699-Pelagomonas_calceolata.AAC.14